VKADDLLKFQLEQRVDEGKVIAHGRRTLLIDPAVFDALHLELAGFLSEDEARGTLNRLGYAMGHNAARRLRDRYHWNDEHEWIAACAIMMSSSGLANAKLKQLAFDHSRGSFLAEFTWIDSYESELHLRHSTMSQSPVCWMLTGYASGYCSFAAGQRLLCLEMECVGTGDMRCVAVVKPIAAWGEAARKSALDLVRFEALHRMHSLHKQLLEKEDLNSEQQRATLTEALKEAKLKALESQVNPHFLFNTINVIAKLAFLEGATETEAMAYALADLMRYSLRSSSDTNRLVTLRDEVEHARQYLLIQKTRFRDRLQFNLEIDEMALDIRVPPLSIQPIIENAFVHGLEPSERPGQLLLSVQRAREYVVISIQDNGVGISGEHVHKLLAGEADSVSDHWSAHTTGLGLIHVRNRLRYYYGEQCQLVIESELGSGTTVRVLLPLSGAPDI
jgi:predicted hydrocarbon binding protein/anti-sigma regulatory factor (Ser/Thr protein kinase)/phosphopantetheinyl transferase (holo-ACP synthase)